MDVQECMCADILSMRIIMERPNTTEHGDYMNLKADSKAGSVCNRRKYSMNENMSSKSYVIKRATTWSCT